MRLLAPLLSLLLVASTDHRGSGPLLFGGYARAGTEVVRLGDTWEWDGARWRLASRGGERVFGDLWERREGRWRPREAPEPVRRVDSGH